MRLQVEDHYSSETHFYRQLFSSPRSRPRSFHIFSRLILNLKMAITDFFSGLMASVGLQEVHAEAPAEEEENQDEGGDEGGEEKPEEVGAGEDTEAEEGAEEEEAEAEAEEEEEDEPVDPKPKLEEGPSTCHLVGDQAIAVDVTNTDDSFVGRVR